MTAILFVGAFVALLLLSPLFALPFLPLTKRLHGRPSLAPVAGFMVSLATVAAAMSIFVWTALALGRAPTLLMFALPFAAMLWNDTNRVREVLQGGSRVQRMVEGGGEVFDARLQVRLELAHSLGATVGYWGVFLFLA